MSDDLGKPFYPITGIVVPPGGAIPKRRDIEVWYQESQENIVTARQVSLFIQAMTKWQTQSVEDQLSYFRIAAIHGQPYPVSWDQAHKAKDGEIYCVHGQPTFPTFHRVYLTLYEEVLHKTMIDIINADGFPGDRGEWKQAADFWRLPFWDWTTKKFPTIAQQPTIAILDPATGDLGEPVTNPMYSYRMAGGITMGDESLGDCAIIPEDDDDDQPNLRFDTCKGTNRFVETSKEGNEKEWVEGTSHYDKIEEQLVNGPKNWKFQGSLAEAVSRLFTPGYFKTWELFATTKYYIRDPKQPWQSSTEWLSLEQVHNAIHNWTGGTDMDTGLGHMSNVPVAAFDPIFWHHHCFIDLLCALWQTKDENKDKWFNNPWEGENPDPKPDAWLRPFHKAKEGPHANYSSNDVRYIEKLYYDYEYLGFDTAPESRDSETQSKLMRQIVNTHLGRTRSEVLDAVDNNPEIGIKANEDNDLILNVLYDRYGYKNGAPYTIYLFVGDVDKSVPYGQNPNLVGSIYNFSTSINQTGCKNCKNQAETNTLHTGQIPITGAMIKDAVNSEITDFNHFTQGEIEKYLEKHLSWRVKSITGHDIPLTQLPGLKVTALLGSAKHSEDDTVLSKYSDYEPLYAATSGKTGGATSST